jgi:hypothetical protein
MNYLRKLLYDYGLKQPIHKYEYRGGLLYRFKQNLWKDDEWVEDDIALNLIFRMREGEQCKILFTDYGRIGSKMMYLFYVHNNRCTYSSESILVDLGKDYKNILGYYPKKLFYTKIYE